jgi:hypothetical protein
MIEPESKNECATHVIARGGLGNVAACLGCGNLHVTLEYLTVRLQPQAFRELVAMVNEAQRQLDGLAARQADTGPDRVSRSSDDPLH